MHKYFYDMENFLLCCIMDETGLSPTPAFRRIRVKLEEERGEGRKEKDQE